MGLVCVKEISPGSLLGLWEINNSLPEMLVQMEPTSDESAKLDSFSNDRKKTEWISVRLLLKKMMNNKSVIIYYTTEGKPFLTNSDCHISISHSGNYSVILLTKESNAGIDIQLMNAKVSKAPDYFLSEKELTRIPLQNKNEWLHVCWGAKEALYKYYGKDDINLKKEIQVEPFNWEETGLVTGRILRNDFPVPIRLKYERMGEYVLVYTINN